MVKNPPAVQETWVLSLGWEEPLEEDMATHSSILAWRIPWTEEPGGLQSMASERVGHDWVTKPSTAHISLYIDVCVCVCVRKREREQARENESERRREREREREKVPRELDRMNRLLKKVKNNCFITFIQFVVSASSFNITWCSSLPVRMK